MYLSLFGKEIPLYGVFFWIGILVAAAVAIFVCKKKNLPLFDLTCSAVYTMIFAIAGAKILFILVSLEDIIELARTIPFGKLLPMIIKGGFVFYGGLIGGVLGLFVYAKQFKMDFLHLMGIYAVVLPLGHAFGRVGCFFGGCCYGIAYDGPLSHTYHVATGVAPVGVPLFPVQLLEALCLLLLFGSQMVLLLKNVQKKNIFVYNYCFCYSIIRFALEFLRGDAERGSFLMVSTSQWISIAIMAAVLLFYFKGDAIKRLLKKNKKADQA